MGLIENYMKKYQVKNMFWVIFSICLIITLVSIPLKQTLAFVIFAIICFIMVIFNKSIVNIIWSGVK